MGKKLTHRGPMAQFLTRWPLKTGKLGKMQFDRIIQQPPPFLVKEHHRDRCDRLGHRINAIDRIGANLRAVAKVQLARSEEHKSELQALMRNSYAVLLLKKKKTKTQHKHEF